MKKKQNVDFEKNYILTDEQIAEMVKRKNDFLAGHTTSRPSKEIRVRYLGKLHRS